MPEVNLSVRPSVHTVKLHQNRYVLSANRRRQEGNIGSYPELYSNNLSDKCFEQVACVANGIRKLYPEIVAVLGFYAA